MSISAVSAAQYPLYYPTSLPQRSQSTPYRPASPQSFGSDRLSVSSLLAPGAGGGFAAYKLGAQMGDHMKSVFGNGLKGVVGGVKNVAVTGLKGMGLSALVGAGVSAVSNGVGVATGKIDSSDAVGNVVSDTITSAVGGLGAVTLAGTGHILLSKFGMGGTTLTIATVALGAIGGVAAGYAKDSLMN